MPVPSQNGASIVWVVAVAMVNAKGEVLVQMRPSKSEHGGLWEFPGGKIDDGESPYEAARREIFEELGVQIAIDELQPVTFASDLSGRNASGGKSVAILLFVTTQWEGMPEPVAATQIAWSVPENLEKWAMPPLDYPLARALAQHLSRS